MAGYCRECGNYTSGYLSGGLCSSCRSAADNAEFVSQHPRFALFCGLGGFVGGIVFSVSVLEISIGWAFVVGLVCGLIAFAKAGSIAGLLVVAAIIGVLHFLGVCNDETKPPAATDLPSSTTDTPAPATEEPRQHEIPESSDQDVREQQPRIPKSSLLGKPAQSESSGGQP